MRPRHWPPAALAILFTVLGLALTACAPGGSPSAGESAAGESGTGEAGVACSYPASGSPARPVDPPSETDIETTGEVSFVITTNEGPVHVTMDRSATPCTIHSFASLAKQGYFDDTQCHRLMDSGGYVLQCGDPTGTGRGGPGYRFADEVSASATYPAGTVAMANSGPDSNGSQFFLVYADTPLPPRYTVFGHMDPESVDTVLRIGVEGQDGSSPDGTGKPNNEARIIKVEQQA